MNLLILLPLVAALAVPLTAVAGDHGKHGEGPAHELELNAGKKWETDAPLRKAMSAIRQSVVATLAVVHSGKGTPATFEASSKEITAQIAYMVSNCKLEPKADAQLHVLIGDMMKGVEELEGKQPGVPRAEGLLLVTRALNAYGEYFSHPGWQSIDLRH
jgi:hypothetical protein